MSAVVTTEAEKRISLRQRLQCMQPGAVEILHIGENTVDSMQKAVQNWLSKDQTLRSRRGQYSQQRAWLIPNGMSTPMQVVIVTRTVE